MKRKYIKYQDYLDMQYNLKQLESRGVKLYFKKNKYKLVGGVVLITLGLITIPIPLTTIPLISAGFYLLGLGTADIFKYKEELKRRIKKWRYLKKL